MTTEHIKIFDGRHGRQTSILKDNITYSHKILNTTLEMKYEHRKKIKEEQPAHGS